MDTPPNEITEKETVQYQESILELQNLLHQKYNGATEHLLKVSKIYDFDVIRAVHIRLATSLWWLVLFVLKLSVCEFPNLAFEFPNHVYSRYQACNSSKLLKTLPS